MRREFYKTQLSKIQPPLREKASKKTQSRRFSHLEIGVQASRVPHLGEKPPKHQNPIRNRRFFGRQENGGPAQELRKLRGPTKCAGLDGLFWMN